MKKFFRHLQPLLYCFTLASLFLVLFSGCQADQSGAPAISLENLSPEKQVYVQQGLIELVPDDLPAPIMPPEPDQLDLGEQTYYQICLACHGNWGQGLTDEWRETGFGGDMNCWQSKCHAANHPPQGFEIPREMPPLLGVGSLSTIGSADQLFQVIIQTMPWWNPGSLSTEEAVNLTAYLMKSRGELPAGIVLTEDNLAAFSLHGQVQELTDANLGGAILIFGLSIAMAAHIWTKQSSNNEYQ